MDSEYSNLQVDDLVARLEGFVPTDNGPFLPVGLDTEFDASIRFAPPRLVLVQICVENRVALFTRTEWSKHSTRIAKALDRSYVVVCGRGLLQDLLIAGLDVPQVSLLDPVVTHPRLGLYDHVNRALSAKAKIVKDKSVQISFRADVPLTPQQLAYAAADARVSLLLHPFRNFLRLAKPFPNVSSESFKRLEDLMRSAHAREEKVNMRFRLGKEGDVGKEARKLFAGQEVRDDEGTRYIVSKKNYKKNHLLDVKSFKGNFVTKQADCDRLFREHLDFCTVKLWKREPFEHFSYAAARTVRGPPGTGKTHALVCDAVAQAKQQRSVLVLCPKNVNCLDVHKRLIKAKAPSKLVVMDTYREHWHEGEYSKETFVNRFPPFTPGTIVVAVSDVFAALQNPSKAPDDIFWDEASLQSDTLLRFLRPNLWKCVHWAYGDDMQMKPFGKGVKSVFDALKGYREAETMRTTFRVGANATWRVVFENVYGFCPEFCGPTSPSFRFFKSGLEEFRVAARIARKHKATLLCTSRECRDRFRNVLPDSTVMTIFASQGLEWENVVVFYGTRQAVDNQTRVVALTRATRLCWVFVPREWNDDGMPLKGATNVNKIC